MSRIHDARPRRKSGLAARTIPAYRRAASWNTDEVVTARTGKR
jgi:hypothetical protein